jgi:hypothetical protein
MHNGLSIDALIYFTVGEYPRGLSIMSKGQRSQTCILSIHVRQDMNVIESGRGGGGTRSPVWIQHRSFQLTDEEICIWVEKKEFIP